MNQHKVRTSSVLMGALFVAIAVSALFGQFNDVDRAKTVLPIAIIVGGLAAVASGIRRLLD